MHNLSGRLLLTYLTLMVLGLGGVIAWTGQQLAAQTIQQEEQGLKLQAHIIANGLREPVEELDEHKSIQGRSLDSLISSYAQNVGGRVTLVGSGLEVLSSSDPNVPPHLEENHPEFMAARAGSEHYDIRQDEWRREERLFVAAPVLDEHLRPLGFVQLSVPTLPIYASIGRTWMNLLGIGGVVLLLTVLVSTLLARQIAVPVQHLTTTSEQIASGRLDERVVPGGPNEIRRLGQAFNRMAERVQEMVAQQRTFVNNAAHDLRSPLTSLRLRLEMLETHGANNPDLTRRYLSQMQREVDVLQRLVDHLLALAAVEESEPRRVPLDLAPLLHELADGVDPLVQQAGLRLNVEVPAHLPAVEANEDQMRSAVRNLLDNAIKYTPAGGAVSLTARAADDHLEICVGDTGVGIAPEALPHVFERFYQSKRVRSRDASRGVGLGLALVRAIVEKHGGSIEASSRVSQGSTFTISLPFKTKQAPSV